MFCFIMLLKFFDKALGNNNINNATNKSQRVVVVAPLTENP